MNWLARCIQKIFPRTVATPPLKLGQNNHLYERFDLVVLKAKATCANPSCKRELQKGEKAFSNGGSNGDAVCVCRSECYFGYVNSHRVQTAKAPA
jgi:hypothetical protein